MINSLLFGICILMMTIAIVGLDRKERERKLPKWNEGPPSPGEDCVMICQVDYTNKKTKESGTDTYIGYIDDYGHLVDCEEVEVYGCDIEAIDRWVNLADVEKVLGR